MTLSEAAEGTRIQWCETHNAQASADGWFAEKMHCYEWWWGEAHPELPLLDPYNCSIVSRILVDPEAVKQGETSNGE